MKIIFFAPTYRHQRTQSRRGGGEISNKLIMENLVSRGNTVKVFTYDSGLDADCCENGVHVISAVKSSTPKFFKFLFRMLYSHGVKKLNLDSAGFDVALCATQSLPVALRYAKRNGIPCGAFIRAEENFSSGKNRLDRIKSFLLGGMFESALARLNFALPNSKYMEQEIKARVDIESIHVVYPPVDVKKNIRGRGDIGRNVTMVGTSIKKGTMIVFELAKLMPDVNFRIIGFNGTSGSDCPPNLALVGWTDVQEEFLYHSDLLLVPSICNEAFGRVVIEGLSAGLPVFVSGNGGLPEAVDYNEELIVWSNNIEDWKERLDSFFQRPQYFIDLANRIDINRYSVMCQVDQMERFLKGLC